MKIVSLALVLLATVCIKAQDGVGRNMQRQTIEQRVAFVHNKFDSAFKFDTVKQAKVDSAFAESFRAQKKIFEEMRANFTPGQQPDPSIREKMQEKMKEIQIARDEKLQEILTEAEYKKFKDEVEKTLMPRVQGRGNGGRPQDGK